MKKILVISSTVLFLMMGMLSASAQKITGISVGPGYYEKSTPGINTANRRYDPPREDYRRPADPRYNRNEGYRDYRNEGYRDYRNDRYRRDSDCDDRRRYEHRGGKDCHCDRCHNHDRYNDRQKGPYDYRDRDRYGKSKDKCSPRDRGRWGRD